MNLHDLQQNLADSIRTLNAPGGITALSGVHLAEERLQIYRNHYVISLTEAVSATYPATRSLLGDSRFQALVRHYVLAHPPDSGCLADYGETFAEWLGGETDADSRAGDIAALEWALERTAMVRPPHPFPFTALAQLPPEQYESVLFQLAPGVNLFSAPWDLVDAYDRLITGDCPAGPASSAISDKAFHWLLYRKEEGVGVLSADTHSQCIVALCQTGSPLSTLNDELTQEHLDALFRLVQKGLIETFSQEQEA